MRWGAVLWLDGGVCCGSVVVGWWCYEVAWDFESTEFLEMMREGPYGTESWLLTRIVVVQAVSWESMLVCWVGPKG